MKKNKLKVALFFPWLKSKGGAEKAILEMLNLKEYDFELYTWVYDKEKTFEEFKNVKVNVMGSGNLPKNKILRGVFLFSSFFLKIPLEKYDYFIVCTSGVGEFILFKNYKPGKTIVCSFTPLRDSYAPIVDWNLEHVYKGVLSKAFYLFSVNIYRFFEKLAWKKIEQPFFISKEVMNRAMEKGILKDKDYKIIYAPVDLEKYKKLPITKGKYFLCVSRFNPPKRQDLLIKAWTKFSKEYPNEKLILAGGLENQDYFNYLNALASGENIEFKPGLDNKSMLKLYQNSKAFVFVAFREDFGIVPFEALAAGKPVIAVEGGYEELIKGTNQYYSIKEYEDEETIIDYIYLNLKKVMKSKSSPKRFIPNELNPKVFQSKLKEMLK